MYSLEPGVFMHLGVLLMFGQMHFMDISQNVLTRHVNDLNLTNNNNCV